MRAAVDDLATAGKQSAVRNLRPMAGELPLPKAVVDRFAAAGFTFDRDGLGCKSYVLLAGRRGHFVKVRATQFVVDGETNDAELSGYLAAVAGRLFPPSE